MNLFRFLSGTVVSGLMMAGLSGCLNPPEYSVVPEIDFKEVQVNRIPAAAGLSASNEITFFLNFRDGDGDLGLTKEDIKLPPYNQPPKPPVSLRGHTTNEFNYLIQPFVKDPVTGQFKQFINAPPFGKFGEYDSTYPKLDVNATKPAPLKGVLRFKLALFTDDTPFSKGQVVRFEITIMDRALHVSNTITTSEITLGD